MLDQLVKLADKLDRDGQSDSADAMDLIIKSAIALALNPDGESDIQIEETREFSNFEAKEDFAIESARDVAGFIVSGVPFLIGDAKDEARLVDEISNMISKDKGLAERILDVLDEGRHREDPSVAAAVDGSIRAGRPEDFDHRWPFVYLDGLAEEKMSERGASPPDIFSASAPAPGAGIHDIALIIGEDEYQAKAFLWNKDGLPGGVMVLAEDDEGLKRAEEEFSSAE